MTPLFEIESLSHRYGSVRALDEVSLSVEPGAIGLVFRFVSVEGLIPERPCTWHSSSQFLLLSSMPGVVAVV